MSRKLTHEAIKGNVYGQWTVISNEIKRHSNVKQRIVYYNVICKCGKTGWRASHTLKNGTTKSCKSCCKTANNEDTFVTSYFNKVKRRANAAKLEFNISIKYIHDLFNEQNKKCALSGRDIFFRPTYIKNEQTASLDRIDSSKGYIEGNVQWVHKDVNKMKMDFSTEYFLQLCRDIITLNDDRKGN